MTSANDLNPVQLSGRSGILAAVPALLGFYPQESLVLICLRGAVRRVGPVIRTDLADSSDALVRQLAGHGVRFADEVVVVGYTDSEMPVGLVDKVLEALAADGIPVLDTIIVGADRAVSSNGEEARAIPDSFDPQQEAMAAALAISGRRILPDRAALSRSIAGPPGPSPAGWRRHLEAAAGRIPGLLLGANPDSVLRGRANEIVDAALVRASEPAGIGHAATAELAVLCASPTIRDAIIARAVTEVDEPWLPMLIAMVTNIPDEDAAELCAMLAVTAYRHGDGALAQVAVDRCVAAEPDHRLARLLVHVMAAGMPPADLAALAAPFEVDG